MGVLVGFVLGIILRNFDLNEDAKTWIKLWGGLFLRMLKALILPLIMACLVTGKSNISVTKVFCI